MQPANCSADMNQIRPQLLELLIFEVAGQRFGLSLTDVREIVRAVPPVPAPLTLPSPPSERGQRRIMRLTGIEGVINLRGSVVPVLDVRCYFRLAAKPLEHSDHLIIASAAGQVLALRVDRAVDIIR